jgi:hypothetical protein
MKVGESSQFVSLAAAPVAVADLVHLTPPQVLNSRSTSISNVFSATTANQPATKTAATPMMTHTHRPVPTSSVLPPVSPTQQAPKTSVTGKPWRDTTADALLAIAPTQIDRKATVGMVITAGNPFSFQQSPPSATPASQHTDEYRHKEALCEETRKQLKLLVDISGTDYGFISRSQQQQQNDVLVQWKKWCVGATLTGFVIKDSLMRLLGTRIKIHTIHDGSGHAMVEDLARSRALKYAVELFKQYTWNLEGHVNQLFPPLAPNPSFRPIPIPTSNTANEVNALGLAMGTTPSS